MNNLVSSVTNVLHKLAPWALFASLAVACWFFVASIWLLIAPPKMQHLQAVSLTHQQPAANVNGGIFSVFEAPKAAEPVSQQPVTNTDFTLQGVFIASPRDNSSAVIEHNGQSRRYRIGSKLEDMDYKLVDVSWNTALLEESSGGQVELTLHETLDLNAAAKSTDDNTAMPAFSQQAAYTPEPMQSQPQRSVKEQINDMFETAVSELQSNPASYLSNMGVMATGDGYEVTNGMNSQIRNNIGLQPGDKVISVNGQSVGQPQQDARLLQEIQRTGSAEIQVQRGSQVITVRQQF